MNERDVRARLNLICRALDATRPRPRAPATVSAALLPALLGAGLAAVACTTEVVDEGERGAGGGQTTTTSSSSTTSTTTTGWGGEGMAYGIAGAPPTGGAGGQEQGGGWGGWGTAYGVAGYAPAGGAGGQGQGGAPGGGGAGD